MRHVFISYRRNDSGGQTGRLFDALVRRFGAGRCFRDIEDLEPGIDFPEALEKALAECEAMLVMIGPGWASASADGVRRLEQADDFVRIEVAAGLARKNVRVIPVRVGGADMPKPAELPAELQPLLRRNAIELSDTRWDYDVRRLGDTLAKHMGMEEAAEPAVQAAPTVRAAPAAPAAQVNVGPAYGKWAAIAVGVLVLVVVGGSLLSSSPDEPAAASAPVGAPVATSAGTPAEASGNVPAVLKVGALQWTTDDRDANVDWAAAARYCGTLKSGSAAAWRLPTTRELQTLHDPKDRDAFGTAMLRPFHAGVRSNWIWSSDKDTASSAFAFDFKTGQKVSLALDFNGGAHALCVSG